MLSIFRTSDPNFSEQRAARDALSDGVLRTSIRAGAPIGSFVTDPEASDRVADPSSGWASAPPRLSKRLGFQDLPLHAVHAPPISPHVHSRAGRLP